MLPVLFYTLHWKSGNFELFGSLDALISRINRIPTYSLQFITWIEVE